MEGSTTRRGGGSASVDGVAGSTSKKPTVGERIEVYWEGEGKYYPGVVKSYHRATGKYMVKYDDGDEERLSFNDERWRPEENGEDDEDDEEEDEGSGEGQTATPSVGTMIEVFWESEGCFFTGKVAEIDKGKKKFKVEYEDGDVERLVLAKERWRLVEPNDEREAANGGESSSALPAVGTKIEVLWPDDNKYYRGVIQKIEARTGKHIVKYEDGDEEKLNLGKEQWRYAPKRGRPPKGGAASASGSGDTSALKVGDAIEVYWPQDEVHYPGKVAEINQKATKKYKIKYDDGDVEHLNLDNEKWRLATQRKRRKSD